MPHQWHRKAEHILQIIVCRPHDFFWLFLTFLFAVFLFDSVVNNIHQCLVENFAVSCVGPVLLDVMAEDIVQIQPFVVPPASVCFIVIFFLLLGAPRLGEERYLEHPRHTQSSVRRGIENTNVECRRNYIPVKA